MFQPSVQLKQVNVMTTLVCKFLSLLFLAVGFGFMVVAGNETFTALQSVGAMFVGLVCMVFGGIVGALASYPVANQNEVQ